MPEQHPRKTHIAQRIEIFKPHPQKRHHPQPQPANARHCKRPQPHKQPPKKRHIQNCPRHTRGGNPRNPINTRTVKNCTLQKTRAKSHASTQIFSNGNKGQQTDTGQKTERQRGKSCCHNQTRKNRIPEHYLPTPRIVLRHIIIRIHTQIIRLHTRFAML